MKGRTITLVGFNMSKYGVDIFLDENATKLQTGEILSLLTFAEGKKEKEQLGKLTQNAKEVSI